MKIKVLVKKSFIDRVSQVRHVPGETLSVTEKRYKEIQKVGDFVEIINETDEETKEAKETEEASERKAADEKPEEISAAEEIAEDIPAADKKEKVAPVQPRRRMKKNGN